MPLNFNKFKVLFLPMFLHFCLILFAALLVNTFDVTRGAGITTSPSDVTVGVKGIISPGNLKMLFFFSASLFFCIFD